MRIESICFTAILTLSACTPDVDGPTPDLLAVDPNVICNEQVFAEVQLTGTGFSPSPVDGLVDTRRLAIPAITLSRVLDLDGSAVTGEDRLLADPELDSDLRVRWHSATTMAFSATPEWGLAEGIYDVTIENPTEEISTLARSFAAVPPPTLIDAQPTPICVAQYSNEVTLSGETFVRIGELLPVVNVGTAPMPATTMDGCTELDLTGDSVALCSTLVFTVDQGAVPGGVHALTVTNPEATACTSNDDVSLHVVDPPTVFTIAPDRLCNAQGDSSFVVSGAGLLRIAGAQPSVTVGAVAATSVTVTESTCTPIEGLEDVATCTELTGLLPGGSLAVGEHALVVTNPATAQCASQEPVMLEVVPPPVVDDVSPTALCTGGGTLSVTGSDLWSVDARLVENTGGEIVASNVAVNGDATLAQVSFGAGLTPGSYELTLDSTTGCSGVYETTNVSVTLGPSVLFLDPATTFNGIAIRATLFVSGVDEVPTEVALAPAGGGDDTLLTDVAWSADSPNAVAATIPAGLAAGGYDVFVRGVGGCDALLANALRVVATPTIALDAEPLTPAFGLENTDVALNVNAVDDDALAIDEVNLQATPRVYLSSASTSVASPLRGVAFEASNRTSGIVPPLPAGTYDLVVVNPDGSVGFAADAYEATSVPPPRIDDASPKQIGNSSGQSVTITGANFFDAAVTVECNDGTSTPTATIDAMASSDTSLAITVDASTVANGGACLLRISNTSNNTFDDWSALSATNPAGNLAPFASGATMAVARRGAGAVVGESTAEAKFLYAIGGDDGDAANALASIEAATLDRFGGVASWRTLQTQLPAGVTLAHAHRAGRFLYLLGGTVAGAPTAQVLRAEVLEPLAAPAVTNVDLRFFAFPDADPDTRDGLAPGAYTYLVAAVFAGDDTNNPGGETLPSEPVTLYAPDVPDGVEVELTWATVFGADGTTPAASYRIYRTTTPNGALADARLMGTVDGTATTAHSFLDNNPAAFADLDKPPLQVGALGQWRAIGALNTPRSAFAFTVATDTNCDEFWYLLGGATDAATESSSYEVISHDASAGDLTFSAQVPVGGSDVPNRREHAAWVGNRDTAPSLVDAGEIPADGCESFVYIGPGATGAGVTLAVEDTVRVAAVEAGGTLGFWAEGMRNGMGVSYTGYAVIASGDRVYAMGGVRGGSASDDATEGEWCSAAMGSCTPEIVIRNFNDSTQDMVQARALAGAARFGAFVYLLGGADETGAASATTELNVR